MCKTSKIKENRDAEGFFVWITTCCCPHDSRLWFINCHRKITEAFSVELKKITKENLKKIMHQDYGVELSDEQANELGYSLLRLTRTASMAFTRAEEKNSSVQVRDKNSLEPKTSM
jgi:hypothetical protein